MSTLKHKYSENIARVIKAARIFKGIGQQDFAKSLGVSQGWISKIERAKIVPSAAQWFLICDLFNIPLESGKNGFVDGLADANFQNRNPDLHGHFAISKKFSADATSTARDSLPLLKLFESSLGENALKEFLSDVEVDRNLFVFLDQPINPTFNIYLIKALIAKKALNPKTFSELAPFFKKSTLHGSLDPHYKNTNTPQELLQIFSKNIKKYDASWKFHSNSSSSITFSHAPETESFIASSEEDVALIKKYRTLMLKDLFKRYDHAVTISEEATPLSKGFSLKLSVDSTEEQSKMAA